VSVTIEGGALVRARLTDVRALQERLGVVVYPEMADLDRYLSPETRAYEASIARGEASTKKKTSAKKPSAKKPR
jgi:hypothetical protein